MARTCGEPDEIELTAMGVKLNGSRCRDVIFLQGSSSFLMKELGFEGQLVTKHKVSHPPANRLAGTPSRCYTLNRHVKGGTLPRMA